MKLNFFSKKKKNITVSTPFYFIVLVFIISASMLMVKMWKYNVVEAVVVNNRYISQENLTDLRFFYTDKIYLAKENRYLLSVKDEKVAARLSKVLNYKLKANERFDRDGNFVVKEKDGTELAFMGYEAQKREYELNKSLPTLSGAEVQKIIQNTPVAPFPIIDWSNIPAENGGVDTLNQINPLFYRNDFSRLGLMYWSPVLYQYGGFSFLPFLTPARSQGARGTCFAFPEVAAVELLGRRLADLSEQNYVFHYVVDGWHPLFTGVYIGPERKWPYNRALCTSGSYHSDLINADIPCSNTVHQGILVDGVYSSYPPIRGTREGGCVNRQALDSIDIDYLTVILERIKYPIKIVAEIGERNDVFNGFIGDSFFGADSIGFHAFLLVGFVDKNSMPIGVRDNPNFKPNEDYYILKNSWGTHGGDGGFYYVSRSQMVRSVESAESFYYDTANAVYDGCDRGFAGVVPR